MFTHSRATSSSLSRFRALSIVAVALALMLNFGLSSLRVAHAGDQDGSSGTVTVVANTDDMPTQGGVITYAITLQNGSRPGLVTLFDNLPSHTTLVSAPGCTEQGGKLACNFALFPYDAATTYITVTVDDNAPCNAPLKNVARVRGWPSAEADVQLRCPVQ